jgi:hypothetical protein
VAAGRVATIIVATRLAGIFPFPDILQLEAKSGPVCSQQMLTEATHFRLFNFRLSFAIFLFSQIVL